MRRRRRSEPTDIWRVRLEPEARPHQCDVPLHERVDVGSERACDLCHTIWEVCSCDLSATWRRTGRRLREMA